MEQEALLAFGPLLRSHRSARGLSQVALAQLCSGRGREFSDKRISEWERGVSVPHVANVTLLADLLELDEPDRRVFIGAAARERDERAGNGGSLDAPLGGSMRARSRVKGRLVAGMAIVVVVVVVVVVVALYAVSRRADHSAARNPTAASAVRHGLGTASITAPVDADRVGSVVVARGEAALSPSASLWLVIKPAGDTTYYVTTREPITVSADGSWVSSLVAGQRASDEGEEYDLFLVIAPDEGLLTKKVDNRPAGQFSARFTKVTFPPSDSVVADKTYLTMVRWHSNPRPRPHPAARGPAS